MADATTITITEIRALMKAYEAALADYEETGDEDFKSSLAGIIKILARKTEELQ